LNDWLALALGGLLLALNAFFVGAEFALISARRSTIEPRAREGSRRAKITLRAMEQISLMLAGAQLGITICSLLLLAVVEPAVAHLLEGPFEALGVSDALLHPAAFVIALTVVGVSHVVLGEMVPKNIALATPDRAALALGPPLVLTVRLLRPALAALNAIANGVLRLVGVEPQDEVTSSFTREEVAGFVEESRREGLLHPSEERTLIGVLQFDERDATSVLLPLDRVTTVSIDATPYDVEQVAARTGFSRFPVRDREDALIGYLHLKDTLETKDVHRHRPIARHWVRPLPRIAAEARLRSVLATMQSSGAHLAQALGRDDSPVGIIALEDVLEELVGEIRDGTQHAAG
jgi:CBS domain containing-hemolysin-like protein